MYLVGAKGKTLNIVTVEGGNNGDDDDDSSSGSGGTGTSTGSGGGTDTSTGGSGGTDTSTGGSGGTGTSTGNGGGSDDPSGDDTISVIDEPDEPTIPSVGDFEYIYLDNSSKTPYHVTDSDVIGIDASNRTKAIKITANSKDNVIIGSTKNDYFTGGSGNDTFVSNGGKDIITDYAVDDVVSLTGDISKAALSGNNVTLTSREGSIVVNNAKGKKVTFVDGSGNITKQTFGVNKLNIVDGDGSTINAIYDSTVITLDGSNRTTNVALIGNAKANTLIGGKASDTLTGGKGKDTFVYSGGNDVITDYTAGQDVIKLDGVSLQSASIDENKTNLILKTNKGNLIINNAIKISSTGRNTTTTYKKITIIDDNNVKTSLIYDSDTLVADDNSGDTLKNFGAFKTIDASNRSKKAITLIGNSSDNTLIGGKKNDTLTGGDGSDVFVYTAGYGNDIITDYSSNDGDIIRLGKKTAVTDASYKDNDLILTVGKAKITVQGGKSEIVTVVNDSGVEMNFKKWSDSVGYREKLFADDNFATNDLNEILSSESNLISGDLDFNENTFDQSNQIVQANYKKKK